MATELQVCSVNAVYQDKSANGKYSIYYNVTSYPTYVTISGYGYISLSKSDANGYEDARVSNGAVSIGGTSVASGKSGQVHISGLVLSDYEKPFTFTRNISRDHSAKSVAIAASGMLSLNGNFGVSTKTGSTSASVSVPAKPSYAVSYNANGGTNGMPSAQTKWHDESLTLQADNGYRKVVSETGEPTKEYVLSSWNTKADGTGTTYALGGTYTGNAAITLYAVWELKYIYPTITNLKVYRTATSSISDVDEDDLGEYIFVSFDWTKCSEDGSNLNITPNCKITIGSDEYTPTPTSNFKYKPSTAYSSDTSISVKIELYDPSYVTSQCTVVVSIGTSILPIDLYGSGTNVYMGIMTPHVQGQELTLTENLYIGANRVADFIVEQGVSGDWTYRKWNSGIAECWKTWTSAAFAPATAVGGFYGRVLPASGTYSLPSGLFVSAPIMSVNLTEWGSGYFWGSARAVTNTSFKITLLKNDNASAAGVAKIYAIGSWK